MSINKKNNAFLEKTVSVYVKKNINKSASTKIIELRSPGGQRQNEVRYMMWLSAYVEGYIVYSQGKISITIEEAAKTAIQALNDNLYRLKTIENVTEKDFNVFVKKQIALRDRLEELSIMPYLKIEKINKIIELSVKQYEKKSEIIKNIHSLIINNHK